MGLYFDGSGQRTQRLGADDLEREDVEPLRPSPGKSSRTHGGEVVRGIPGKVSLTMRLAQRIDRCAREGRSATPDECAREMVAEALGSTGRPLAEAPRRQRIAPAGHKSKLAPAPPPRLAPTRAWSAPIMRQSSSVQSTPPLDTRPLEEAIELQGGHPLPEPVRRALERKFGVDLSGVRVHTDESAALATATACANAFTIGNHIFFGRGHFSPDTQEGYALLVHELTHVIQWYQGRIAHNSGGLTISDPADPLEREAESISRFSSHAPFDHGEEPAATLRRAAPKAMAAPAVSAATIYRQERQASHLLVQYQVAVARGNRRDSIRIVRRGHGIFAEISPVGTPG